VIYFAVGFLAITLLPTSNLVVLIGSIFAERFLYLPSIGFAIAAVALAFRLKEERTGRAVLAVAVVVLAGRTYARNFDWKDNLALASADVNVSADSFRTHDLLARALYIHDARANIDRAIQEGEIACRIVRGLPAEYVPADTLRHLGLYYSAKGDQAGGASAAQGRVWYQKALEILLRAREAEQAGVRLFEREQLTHGRPMGPRIGNTNIYLNLGTVYGRLGEHGQAIEALRYARGEDPSSLDFYVPLSSEYLAAGDAERAAATMLQKASLDGMKAETVYGVREAFTKIPGGECAVAALRVNYACEAVRQRSCAAAEDLAQAYVDARRPAQAQEQRDRAAREFGCGGK
jgi:tetratricopeptide (TPR) repeat protein